MTRVHRVAKARQAPMSAALHEFLLSGSYELAERAARAAGEADAQGFKGLVNLYLTGDRHEDRWREYEDELVDEWIREHPGTRPAGWWQFTATEPRCVRSGRSRLPALLVCDAWRTAFGVPFDLYQITDGEEALTVESEPSYLRRLALLKPGERKRIALAAFEPEEITITDDEDTESHPDEEE